MATTHKTLGYHFESPLPTAEDVNQSNEALVTLFARTLSQIGTQTQFESMKREYVSTVGESNPVVVFNGTNMRYYSGPYSCTTSPCTTSASVSTKERPPLPSPSQSSLDGKGFRCSDDL